MRKYFIISLLMIISCILFVGCGFSKKSRYEKTAKQNAIQYIEDKYGFKPNVKRTSAQVTNNSPIPFSTASATGYVYVKMEHDDNIFYVFISGLNQNTDGVDNYQHSLIENAVSEKLHSLVPNIINIDYHLGSLDASQDDPYFGMISLKYDGNNLKEVLEEFYLKQIVISLYDYDLSNLTEEVIHEHFGSKAQLLFVNYKSVEDYQKSENTTYGLGGFGISTGIEKNDAYIVEYKEF